MAVQTLQLSYYKKNKKRKKKKKKKENKKKAGWQKTTSAPSPPGALIIPDHLPAASLALTAVVTFFPPFFPFFSLLL
jgi:hypothetical protein